MAISEPPSISVKEHFSVEAKADVALIKLHVAGEGVSISDAVESAQRKTAEIGESLRNTYKQIERVNEYDVYFGQKQERFGAEPQAYPRPLVVRGILITATPAEPAILHRIMDEGIKQGALLRNPQRSVAPYLSSILESALLFGLIGSEEHEHRAIEQCLERAEKRCRALAAVACRKIGKLLGVRDVSVDPSIGEPFHKEFAHIRRVFPTRFLSPTPHKVLVCASLTAQYEMTDL